MCVLCHLGHYGMAESHIHLLFSQTHSGSVWKVTWAHPEFGQVLATCSFDRTALIWEEQGFYHQFQMTF